MQIPHSSNGARIIAGTRHDPEAPDHPDIREPARSAAGAVGDSTAAGTDGAHATLLAMARPGKRKRHDSMEMAPVAQPAVQASLQTMPDCVVQHIGESVLLGDGRVSKLASASRQLSRVLRQQALADRLAADIDRPLPAGDPADHFVRIIAKARDLPEPLRCQIAQRLTQALPEKLLPANLTAYLPCDALRMLIGSVVSGRNRYRLTMAFAAMLSESSMSEIDRPAGDPAMPSPALITVRNAFVADCETWLATQVVTPMHHATLFGALAQSLALSGPPSACLAAWQALAGRDDCGDGDTRLSLLTGLTDAVRHLPFGAAREHALEQLTDALPSLSADGQVKLIRSLAPAGKLLASGDSRLASFDRLMLAGRALPQPQRSSAMRTMHGYLHRQPRHRRQALYDGFFAEVAQCPADNVPALLSALAQANHGVPTMSGKVAAIDALFAATTAVSRPQAASVSVHVFAAIEQIPGDALRQFFVAKATRFTRGFSSALRKPLIEGLIDAAAAVNGSTAHVAASLEVVALIAAQPQCDRLPLLRTMYENLAEEDRSNASFALMAAFGRVAETLPPSEQASLVADAVRGCMRLEPQFLPLQFQIILAGAAALPGPCDTQAMNDVAQGMAAAIRKLEVASPFLMLERFQPLLCAASMTTLDIRAGLLEELVLMLVHVPDEMAQSATRDLSDQIMCLPHEQRSRLVGLL